MERKYKRDRIGSLRRGLKKVNIGEDVWLYGRQNQVPEKGLHMVIYGPERKEYHVWNDDVVQLTSNEENEKSFCNRNGNRGIQSNVKIYILTSILDKRENWCFDLTKIPDTGKLKVICENGTVKNIDFDGTFRKQELVSRRTTFNFPVERYTHWPPHSTMTFVDIVGYRKK